MTKANKQAAFNTLNKFANARVALIEGMQKAGYATVEECKPIVIEWACSKTGGAFKESSTGKVLLDSGHKKYNTTKGIVRDVMLMLAGTTRRASSAKKEVDLIEEAMKIVAKMTPAQKKKFLSAL